MSFLDSAKFPEYMYWKKSSVYITAGQTFAIDQIARWYNLVQVLVDCLELDDGRGGPCVRGCTEVDHFTKVSHFT